MVTFLAFILVILVLVLSHEFGHFIVAKWRGMRVDEFGFGFPPRIFGKQIGETLYSINLLPFGGFVKIWGEDDEGESGGDPRNFSSRAAWERFLVLFAGVCMNMVVAYVFFSVSHGIGVRTAFGNEHTAQDAKDIRVQVVEVAAFSPAAEAGILMGDALLRLEAEDEELLVSEVADVQKFIAEHAGTVVAITLARHGEMSTVKATPRVQPPAGEGALGIAMAKTGVIATPWYRSPVEGLRTTWYVTRAVASGLVLFFGNLFQLELIGDVSGPLAIAQVAGQASALGAVHMLQLIALLSVNLAILNILPIPALDGGRIFFLLIEKLRGAPLQAHVSQLMHMIGFIALVILMLLITYRDVVRIL